MKKNRRLLLGLLATFASTCASAMPTAWEFKGHITTVTGSFAGQINVGDAFRILVSYDTDEPVVGTRAGTVSGARYLHSANSMTYRIEIGTACTPCEPGTDPAQSGIIVRDNYANLVSGVPELPLDGITFNLVTDDGIFVNLLMRGPVTDIYSGSALPVLPDPRLATLDLHALQACPLTGNSCDDSELDGTIESVTTPTFGTNYTLTARDCYYIDSTTAAGDPLPRDCINFNGTRQRAGYGRKIDVGGGLGSGEFSRTTAFTSDWSNYPVTGNALGTVFGAITFGGPSGLPVLKASALPTDIARVNSNLLAYQRYTYSGPATTLPLVVDLGWGIADNSTDAGASAEIGLRPGGAQLSTVLAIVDGAIPMPSLANQINTLDCGVESQLSLPDGSPWPAGSILGSASYNSPQGQDAASTTATLDVRSCANPTQPVQLAANQSFIVATSIQTPARGKWSSGTPAAANGYVDASHTMRVTFDPNAPPAVVQQLADAIAPQCTQCFAPEVVPVTVDVRPGSSACINPKINGVIPVAILGSPTFRVQDVRTDASLSLGALKPRMHGDNAQCSTSDVNNDGIVDLVCQFENVASNWAAGQTAVTLSGKLRNGLPIQGTGTICVK